MTIWLALLIPVITVFILYFFFGHDTAWWEFAIPFAASLIIILVMKFTTEKCQTSDTEYWGEPLSQAIHSQAWDEEVSCRHSYDCNCSTDKDGNEHCSTCYMHSYDVDYHPEYWEVTTASGNSANVSQSEYSRLVKKWANENFEDQHRDFHSIDGDWYVSTCPNINEKLECFVTEHSYENRVQASNSVFNYPEVKDADKKFYGLYDYPEITEGYRQKCILGTGDNTQIAAEGKFQILNARLGPKKQAKVFVLIFPNKSEDVAFQQECYWKGGNKNEFIVCIGIDNSMNVKWCKPFSFTEVDETKIETRNFVQGMGRLNLSLISDFLYKEIDAKFKRKQFKEFSYLTIEPKGWQIVLTFILTVIINICLSLWIIKNDFDEENPTGDGYKSEY